MGTLRLKALKDATKLSAGTLRHYADAGFIPCKLDSNGHRLFPESAVAIAKTVHAERMARVGRRPGR